MFYCVLHNWSSPIAPCPACHKTVTITLTREDRLAQKSKTKDWDIIEFRHVSCPNNPDMNWIFNGAGYVTRNNKTCSVQSLETMLNYPYVKIHSVRRCKDGELFSVGDWCYVSIKNKSKRITHFNINEGGVMFLNFSHAGTNGLNITLATKTDIPKPLSSEWQIECFTDGRRNWWRNKDGLYTNMPFESGIDATTLLKSPPLNIFSVKRLSDNEMFNIGEKIEADAGSPFTIKSFDVVDEPHFPSRMRVLSVEYGGWDITRIRKIRKKEPVCGVNLRWEIQSHPTDLRHVMKASDCRFIGTMEECEAFIEKHGPQKELKERWNTTDVFVAACTALDNIMKSAKDDADGKNGLWSLGHINTFQDELKKLGYSIQPISKIQ